MAPIGFEGRITREVFLREFFSSEADWEAARKLVVENVPEEYRSA